MSLAVKDSVKVRLTTSEIFEDIPFPGDVQGGAIETNAPLNVVETSN